MAPILKTITILGATGTQGSSIVSSIAALNTGNSSVTWHIRAVTRNPSSSKAQLLKEKHSSIELVRADLNDASSLRTAFKGANAIFAVTDFWAPFSDRRMRSQHSTGPNPGDSLRRFAFDLELQQGRNIADAAAAVLSEEPRTLERFIWSGLPSCKENSAGKYKAIYHFDSKAAITEYIKQTHTELARRMNVLYVSFYASNVYFMPLMRPVKQTNDAYLLERLCSGAAKHPFVLTHVDTGRFVVALLNQPSSVGKTLLAYTAILSWLDIAALVSKATSKNVGFKEVSVEDFRKRHPMDGEEILSAKYSEEFGFVGNEDVLKPEDVGVALNDGAERIEQWLADQDWSGLL